MKFSRIMKAAEVAVSLLLSGGIEVRRSFHSLRHSFTSRFAAANIHADVRHKLNDHSSAAVHARYMHRDAALPQAIPPPPRDRSTGWRLIFMTASRLTSRPGATAVAGSYPKLDIADQWTGDDFPSRQEF